MQKAIDMDMKTMKISKERPFFDVADGDKETVSMEFPMERDGFDMEL